MSNRASGLADPEAATPRRPGILHLFTKPEFGPFVLLAIELAAFDSLQPLYLSPINISNILDFTVELGLIALPTTLLMIAGEFDLSVGSMFGFSAVLMWILFNSGVASLGVAFLIALVVAALIGLLNGWLVTRLRIASFLVTLGMLLVVRGAALYLTQGFPQHTWDAGQSWLTAVLVGEFRIGTFHASMSFFWFIAAALALHYVLTQSKSGNWIQAAGGNPNAARARGVNVARTKMALFVLTSVMAGFSGIVSSIRTSAANPNSGTGYELEVIAMVVIGGTALAGGRGTIIGTVLGIFLLRMMRSGLIMIGVPGLAYEIFVGTIILVMVALQAWLEHRQRVEG